MRGVAQLTRDFEVYFREIDSCLQQRCYWALLHILLSLPDICAALENPAEAVGKRYVRWCNDNMPSHANVSSGDRYQMRNAVLHQGTSLPPNRTKESTERSSYRAFSFVDPQNFQGAIHQTVSGGSGGVLNMDVSELAKDTRTAMENWFRRLQSDSKRMTAVERNLPTLVRLQPKASEVAMAHPIRGIIIIEKRGVTTSSS
jgi:hypothetical protein